MRLAMLGACTDTFYVLIDGLHFEPRCVDKFSKRRATLALRQPAQEPTTQKRCRGNRLMTVAALCGQRNSPSG